ncbi:hypothetical protein M5689_016940 [Euphorbia peplus]|nr:hypothetical protein M5689_016940 [Euphorbia peplus]
MKTIMSKTPHDSSFSFSRRYFSWNKKKLVEDDDLDLDHYDDQEFLTFNSSSHFISEEDFNDEHLPNALLPTPPSRKMVSKLRSALSVFTKGRSRSSHSSSGLGTKLVGTLFGYRRGHVQFAFQEDAKVNPGFLIELAMPTSVLVREMASGLVRIALECEKKQHEQHPKKKKLVEECLWRTYCNGKKCGYAIKRECGPQDWKVLKAVEPISMGAGVLPAGNGEEGSDLGELMYMRARFERVVGSKDSEAFYMLNPDGSSGPELSVYLLRV